MKRISRAAVTAFCTGTLALGGLGVGITGAHATASSYNMPSARHTLATSAVLGNATTAAPDETTTRLPLLGAPLVVDVTSGPGGALSGIDVSSMDVTPDLTDPAVEPSTVHFADDADTAKIQISSQGGGQNVSTNAGTAAAVSGPRSWTGELCDHTPVNIAYTVNTDGTISGTTATPAADIHSESSKGVSVTFSNNERVRIRVKSSDDGTSLRVSVQDRIRCNGADPSIDTPASTTADAQGSDSNDSAKSDSAKSDSAKSDSAKSDHVHGQGSDDGSNDDTAPSSTVAGSTSSTADDPSDDDATETTTSTSTRSTTAGSTATKVDDNGDSGSSSDSGSHGSDNGGGNGNRG